MTASITRDSIIRLAALHVFALIIGFMLVTQARAQESLSDKQKRFDALYEQMLSNPSNLDLTVEYAELAVDMGDYEAAIPPLERVLMTNPDVAKVKLELGILYYLLGSYDVARSYLQEAKVSATAQPEIKQQADDYLQRM